MSKIKELVKLAEKAGTEAWECRKIRGETHVIRSGSFERMQGFFSYQPIAEDISDIKVAKYIAAANPQAIKEIANEMEAKDKRVAELEERVTELESEFSFATNQSDEYFKELQRIRESVPKEIPTSVYKVIYDQCGGFVDCGAEESVIWSACRAEFLRIIEGNKDE